MTRVRIQTFEDDGTTGQVFIRDTSSANGGAWGAGGGGGLSDGSYGDVVVSGGGTVITVVRPQIKSATITVPYGLQEQTVTVVDASCTAASKVLVGWGATTADDENQPQASDVTFSAVPAAGSLDVTVSDNGVENVGGTYKILYTLG